ncbi:metallophosphoesterase family protein [Hymenobacter sp. BT770]|uniref:metallophosphoesterase family protein n=1 Tax=Hymenobacter sp. BT770 TaxID=2886942 RepID=UPI001D130345|nr:metallophosphoesterase family protein [Hymenobacter sp. BT770]MCC3154052.1 serine/threonine protein phosphatase [Hymenobacter sp. BT770]MDO3416196.1 metallophosphoesterase family protein [Hymenobacter sp. BT770]
MRRYATTDLHGCLQTFRYLVEEELRLTTDDELYLLGDYVNKGPDSRGVLDYLMQLQATGFRVHCLRGNHDQALLDSSRHRWRWDWLGPRGRLPTLRSFGVRRMADIPARYLEWLAALPYEIELDDFVLVHAGYNFALPPAEMRRDYSTMLNIKKFVFDPSRIEGKRLLHGHVPTPTAQVLAKASARPEVLGLDTGCVYRHNPELAHLAALNLDTWELTLVANREPPYAIGKR